jgi:signal transduction histidine kinase
VLKRITFHKKTLVYAAGTLVVSAAIFLAVLQYHWIRDSNHAERERERRSVRISIERGLEELGSELHALISFAFVPPDESSMTIDLIGIADSVELWREQADDAELLRSLYVINAESGVTYDIAAGSPELVDLPNKYASLTGLDGNKEDRFSRTTSLLSDGIIVLPFDSAIDETEAESKRRYMVIELDLYILFNSLLPKYMDSYLPGYSYRIVRNERVKYVYGDANFATRQPDASYPLFLPLVSSMVSGNVPIDVLSNARSPDIEPGDPANSKDGSVTDDRQINRWPADPASRFWFLRLSSISSYEWGNSTFASNPNRTQGKTGAAVGSDFMTIEFYYPNASFDTLMNRRMFADLAVSYGFLLLFLGAIVGLLAVYRRSERFRIREREFVSAMSHELRTPVSVIRSISENLADGVSLEPSRLAEYGGLIREQSHRLGRMVESILMVSGLNQNAVTNIEWSSTNIAAIVDDVVRILEPTALELGVTVHQNVDVNIGEFLTDHVALRLILENLVMNAIRHGRSHGRSYEQDAEGRDGPGSDGETNVVTVGAKIISDLDPESRWYRSRRIRIWVEDEGPGIPQREQRRVFDAFYRGVGTRNNQTPGSGLGLHLVRRVIRLINGEVKIESPYYRKDVQVKGVRIIAELPEGKES